ncbi:MAG TPA: DUF5777 family beta-barrel protein [Thermoanaerobaculia bacterium]|nr:DUF5777 family beta-barrel protein [Thermoanaerobaculia bacterium]
MIKRATFCLLFSAVSLSAQVQNAYTPVPPLPLGDVLLSLPTSHMSLPGTWEIRFTHRFNQSIDQGSFSDRIHSLFGLDSNADVGIGLSYVPVRDLELSAYRSNALDDIELGAKYNVFQQARAIPFSAAVRAGGDWRTEADLNDRTSVFAQAILARQFGKRAEISIIPTYVTNAGRVVSGNTSAALFRNAFNVPIGAAVMLTQAVSVIGEVVPRNRDLPADMHGYFAWSAGLKTAIGGHFFELMLTNSNATHVDQYVTSTYMGSPLHRGDLHIGFNIERRFGR